jgi:4-hydroxybenzoate polyprenyltransferase
MAETTPEAEEPKTVKEVPICVDLDGTLVRTDTLVESALLLLKESPFNLFSMLAWLLGGKANLKQRLAERVLPDPGLLPYHQGLLEWLRERKLEGRRLVLVTAANNRIAEAVADHLGIFDEVIASCESRNMSAHTKAGELASRYGVRGFDYVGTSHDDLPVWTSCHEAVIVSAPEEVAKAARGRAPVAAEFPPEVSPLRALLTAMRPRQWSKNLLVFVSIVIGQSFTDGPLLASTIMAFISFCLVSSSVYLVNDMLDLTSDRSHSEKNRRPFASGSAPLIFGVVGAPALLVFGLLLAGTVSAEFFGVLSVYLLLTLSYSFYLKRHELLDVLVLAMLYTLRIIAGAAVAESLPSVWLMSFSMFIFTSLAMAKRYAELKALESEEGGWVGGRGYHVHDLSVVAQLGTSSGYISILVLALYVDSAEVGETYDRYFFMYLLCPLLMYWIGRIWVLASRGMLTQDPVIFATRDRVSYIIFLLGGVLLWAAL